MTKHRLTQMEKAVSYKNGFCAYCGSPGATLEPNKNRRGGYHGKCVNDNCGATPCFSSPKVVAMIEG